MVDRHGQKPDCLFIGSIEADHAVSLADIEEYARRAKTIGCHVIRVSCGGEMKSTDVEDLARRWLGRLGVAVSVSDLSGVEDTARMGTVAMLAVPAHAATDPQVVARVAETGLPALVEVNLLSAAGIENTSGWFAPGQLTLMWDQICSRDSALETVEDLFALVSLRRYGRPVGYVGVGWDPLAIAVAIGFGAVVLDAPLSDTGRSSTWPRADAPALVARLQHAQHEPGGELLRASDLNLVDELRPSLVAARLVRQGETLTAEMVTCKAPFRGLSPGFLPFVVGRRALYDIAQDEPITFGVIDL